MRGSSWIIQMVPKSNDTCPYNRHTKEKHTERHTDGSRGKMWVQRQKLEWPGHSQTHREDDGKTKAQMEWCGHKPRNPRNADGHQKFGDKEGFSPRTCGGSVACQHLDFRLWPSELWEQISVILSHQLCGSLLWQTRN